MMRVRVVSWNLNARSQRLDDQLAFLSEFTEDIPALLALQEVSSRSNQSLADRFSSRTYAGSLQLRRPRQYDGKDRKLGCALVTLGGLGLAKPRMVPDVPLPERTLVADVERGSTSFLVGSFHALTGSGFGSAKPIMFQGLTRYLKEQTVPVVFGIDRNAPKQDRFPASESQWWWPGDNQEPLLFGPEAPHPCRDTFISYLDEHPGKVSEILAERPDGPLGITYYTGKGRVGARRYDAVYASPHWRVLEVRHIFDRRVRELSDHGAVIADLELS